MRRLSFALLSTALLTLGAAAQAANWQAGKHYTVLTKVQPTNVGPGKVEVMEVFSYGCPACNNFRPFMKKLKTQLPANAQLVYLPASWNAAENWPLFQRAYITAQSLGIADKTHDAMYDAIWTSGELAVVEADGRTLKKKLPSIEDTARFYQRVAGVKAADFVAASKSFGVDLKIKQAERQIKEMQVPSTPTFVINGKYRVNNDELKSGDELIDLIKFLVAKEATTAPAAAPAKKPG
jgi:thiol:disulfide interchange protein DsbA